MPTEQRGLSNKRNALTRNGGGFSYLVKGISKMAKIKIDNVEYDSEKLSAEAKSQLVSIQYVDQELARLQAQAAALQTARISYANALKEALPKKAKK